MKNRKIVIEWIILVAILVIIIPFLYIKFNSDHEGLFSYFRSQIRYINPLAILFLIFSQIWRIRRSNGLTRKEVWKSLIPFSKKVYR